MVTKWGVHRLKDMIGSGAMTPDYRYGWVRAVPLPYRGGNIYAAWMVLTGRAYAVEWPNSGDLERILDNSPDKRSSQA